MVNNRTPDLIITDVGLSDLEKTAQQIVDTAGGLRIWLFHGDMGAGKTTFIKALAKELNIYDTISSPTYALVNEYRDSSGEPYFHFDFYRIESDQEAEDIGVTEYFDSGKYCFIEWPEKIEKLLPDSYLSIDIQASTPSTRRFEIRIYE